jgi:hypothetical protein
MLLVVGDGPRPDRPDDARLVAETRALIDGVDWPCEVRTCFSEENLNCHRRIATGLDWVFANVPEAIILEDDCLPHPTFFRYCEELLERYRDDERVHMISGSNPSGAHGPDSYHFSRCYAIWGWATWARAWQHNDPAMREWVRLRKTRWLEDHLGDDDAARLARIWFDYLDQWDFHWLFSGWIRGALTAMPSVNLVSNIGFGQNATHMSRADDPYAEVASHPIDFPLRHPTRVEVVDSVERAVWDGLITHYGGGRRPRLVSRLRGRTRNLKRRMTQRSR